MIDTKIWFLRCDACRQVYGESDNRFELERAAVRDGWVLRVKRDGTRAQRGGKDYCPDDRPVRAALPEDGTDD